MLVIVTEDQILPPQTVCQTCVLADRSGKPRWRQGRLCCGRLLQRTQEQLPLQYQCQMGFRVTNVE